MLFKTDDERLIALMIEDIKEEIEEKQELGISVRHETLKLEFYRDLYETILEERECRAI